MMAEELREDARTLSLEDPQPQWIDYEDSLNSLLAVPSLMLDSR